MEAGIFSADHIDPGSALLAEHLPKNLRGRVADLGAGWGFLSRAALETLAIIAYCQPVTRAEIEDVRGVAVSSGTLDILMEASWVRPRGRRRTPGRPVTFGTTESFLIHFGLDAIDSLPGRDDLKAAGLLSAEIPRDFEFAGTPRDPETGELLGEDPLEDREFQPDFLEGAEDRS